VQDMYEHVNPRNGLKSPLISEQSYKTIMAVRTPLPHASIPAHRAIHRVALPLDVDKAGVLPVLVHTELGAPRQ
jgi:hypothetical protein